MSNLAFHSRDILLSFRSLASCSTDRRSRVKLFTTWTAGRDVHRHSLLLSACALRKNNWFAIFMDPLLVKKKRKRRIVETVTLIMFLFGHAFLRYLLLNESRRRLYIRVYIWERKREIFLHPSIDNYCLKCVSFATLKKDIGSGCVFYLFFSCRPIDIFI